MRFTFGIVACASRRPYDEPPDRRHLPVPSGTAHLPLLPEARAWTCASGHSFDIARSGYVNLLQPQDRRSPDAGDPTRGGGGAPRLLAAGVGRRSSTRSWRGRASTASPGGAVADLGCGVGDALGLLQTGAASPAVGIDLVRAAVDIAARRFPTLTWVVANADRRLPLLDGSVSLVVSLHARRNPAECQRVLAPGGHLLVAVPAPDDLIELRRRSRARASNGIGVPTVIAEHASRVRRRRSIGRS